MNDQAISIVQNFQLTQMPLDHIVTQSNTLCYTDPCEGYLGGRDEYGRRHGVGKICWSDGSSYEGEWLHNLRHGNGVFKTSDK